MSMFCQNVFFFVIISTKIFVCLFYFVFIYLYLKIFGGKEWDLPTSVVSLWKSCMLVFYTHKFLDSSVTAWYKTVKLIMQLTIEVCYYGMLLP